MAKFGRTLVQALVGLGLAGVAWLFMSGEASAAPKPATTASTCTDAASLTGVVFTDQNNAVHATVGDGFILDVHPGDTITVTFSVDGAVCPSGVELSLVSYGTASASFVPGAAQQLFQADTKTFAPGGPYQLTVQVPQTAAGGSDPNCNPQHDNSNGGGANQSPGPYDPSGCGLPSGNGKSTDNNSSKPCAGCVGNADAKNPPGQYPDGSDPNAGYECDRNQGVGQTNPAHTGCAPPPHFQLDFVFGQPITDFTTGASYFADGRLINYANG